MEAIKPLNVDKSAIQFPTIDAKKDPTRTYKAMEWHGEKNVSLAVRPMPMVTDPKDAILRISSTTICGSDLHFYNNAFQGMKDGMVMGHEFMGYVDAVGPEVKDIKVGDRVVCCFDIACGKCEYCLKGAFSCCDTTNPSERMEALYGHRIGGAFGYSALTGGYDGGQAEFVRVPYADVNLLKVPKNLPDEKLLFLSDVACTGWHANEMGEVKKGDVVAVWGCGPIGLTTMYWARFRGASRIIAIDNNIWRLRYARDNFGAETINFAEEDVMKTIQTLVPHGPDVCVEASGFRFVKGIIHTVMRKIRLETDSPQQLTEAIRTVKKAGKISIIADYFGMTNMFPIGAFMEKGLTARGGQTPVQRYWKELLGFIDCGKADLSWLATHQMPLEEVEEAYRIFNNQEPGVLKIVLKPQPGNQPQAF